MTYDALRKARFASDQSIAAATGLGVEKCRSSLSFLCQAGRAMFDLKGQVFRHRELFLTPFSAQEAASLAKQTNATGNPQEKAAQDDRSTIKCASLRRDPQTDGHKPSGSAKGSDNHRVRPLLHVDHEGHIIEASCTCGFYKKSKLTQGPCEHILALRFNYMN